MQFQSTRPSRGETCEKCGAELVAEISIHSPLAGRDFGRVNGESDMANFNPLAPRGARPGEGFGIFHSSLISIHSPLAGRDGRAAGRIPVPSAFQSTRPSRGETNTCAIIVMTAMEFQSTRPSRGETRSGAGCGGHRRDFNPLAPRGARLNGKDTSMQAITISIHSPLAGRDEAIQNNTVVMQISIHSPLAGRDPTSANSKTKVWPISIHSPLAGRDASPPPPPQVHRLFQSTRPSRGETQP